jgi:hypothetical protein
LVTILLASGSAAHPAGSHPTASPSPAALSPVDLFSRRALRQARLIIQMRMQQLRDERLECVRQALLRRLPDALWPEVPTPSRGTPDAATAIERCDRLLSF